MTNWIKTRAECNTSVLFNQLKDTVKAHVKEANAHIPPHDFTIDDSLADLLVVRVDGVPQRSFRLDADAKTIDVTERGREGSSFKACAVFGDDDNCTLQVEQLSSQDDETAFIRLPDLCTPEDFSRRVLEPIFFPES